MYELAIYKVASTVAKEGFTVVDPSVEWEMVDLITGDTEQECLRKAQERYGGSDDYHYTYPAKVYR